MRQFRIKLNFQSQKSSALAKIIEDLDDIKVLSIDTGYASTFFRAAKYSDDTKDEKEIESNKKLMALPVYPTGGDESEDEEGEGEEDEEGGTCAVCSKTTEGDCGVSATLKFLTR